MNTGPREKHVPGRTAARALLVVMTAALCTGAATGCVRHGDSSLERIRQAGRIAVITENAANCYYLYRDRPMGFEYDLARAFADHLGCELEIVTPAWDTIFSALEDGRGDVIAAGLTITPQRETAADFSDAYLSIQQHLILHKDNRNISSLEDLNGRDIHVRKGSSYHERLAELKSQGLAVRLVLHQSTPTEELLRQVAEKEIECTVADSSLAFINRRYYPDLRLAFPIEEEQSLGWAVRKGDTALLDAVNDFFDTIRQNGTFGKLYEKYYANVEIFDYVDVKKFHARLDTRLPRYKKTIVKAADKYGFDWRLIAAVIYQESHFDHRARSHTGVRGLMQLTQSTARAMGITNRLNPDESIMGGVKYLRELYNRYEGLRERDRMLITLASYNVGRGHILDARNIARTKGMNHNSWAALRQVLPLLRSPEYYRQARYGYCRGTEPVRYVDRVLMYYDIIRQKALARQN